MQATRPCKFYLQGNCRFGANCWYQHPQGAAQGQQNRVPSTVGSTNVFGSGKNDRFHYSANQNMFSALAAKPTNQVVGRQAFGSAMNTAAPKDDASSIVQLIAKEMQSWEPSKMWPLSCFSYAREQPCLSGLQDYSPEELRIEAYNARVSNTLQQYVSGIAQLGMLANKRKSELKSLTVMTLKNELQKASQESMLGAQQGQSLGASSFQQASSPFVASSAGVSSSNPFAKAQQTTGAGLFGSQTAAAPSGLFKPASFGGTTAAFPSLFGKSTTQQQAPFGSQSVLQQPTSGFGASQAPQASGSLFGGNQSSVFGAANSSVSSQNPFLASKPSLFGSQTQPTPTTSSTPVNPFLAKTRQTQNIAQAAPLNLSKPTGILSHISFEATAEDTAAFQATSFRLGGIPERPPPLELC